MCFCVGILCDSLFVLPLAMWTVVQVFVELPSPKAPFYELFFQFGSLACIHS